MEITLQYIMGISFVFIGGFIIIGSLGGAFLFIRLFIELIISSIKEKEFGRAILGIALSLFFISLVVFLLSSAILEIIKLL